MKHKISSKILVALLVACLAVTTACAGNPDSSSSSSSEASSSSEVSSEVSSQPSSSSEAESSSQAASSSNTTPSSSNGGGAVTVDPAAGAVPESAKQPMSYFDGTVFLGDSVSLKLKNYVTQQRKSDSSFFGKGQFLVAGSMGSGNALKPVSKDSVHPVFNGEKMLLEDSVKACGAKKVYIMYGINDIAPYGIDGAVRNMETLIKNILAKSPGVKIYVQSATPMVASAQLKTLNNPNLKKYNTQLAAMCQKNGYYYIDVASVLQDKDGNLPREYCSDPDNMGIHFTDAACKVWIDYLLTHTA